MQSYIKDIMVSFYGTWMKRGYESKYGISFVIEYYTWFVIEFEILIMYCYICYIIMLWIYNKYIFLYIAEMCCQQECR